MNAKSSLFPGRDLILALLTLFASGTATTVCAQCCGALDTDFNPYYGANDRVTSSVLQGDGKIIIGGWFTTYWGTRNHIGRLTTTAAADTYNASLNGAVLALALDTSDGTERAVAVGPFNQANSYYTVSATARFLSNGNYDTNFTSPSIDVYPYTVAVQSNGKILLGGAFTYVGGHGKPRIARLNVNGSVDTGFTPASINGTVYAIKVLPGESDKILIGGLFSSVNGYSRGNLAKLNSDGTLDTSFPSGSQSLANGTVYAIDRSDFGYVIGGAFTQFNGSSCAYFARVYTGSGDLNGVSSTQPNGTVRAIKAPPSFTFGDFIIGGEFTTVGGTSSAGVAWIKGIDLTRGNCNVGGFTGGTGGAATSVDTITAVSIPFFLKAFCGGNFTSYNGSSRYRVAQIYAYPLCPD